MESLHVLALVVLETLLKRDSLTAACRVYVLYLVFQLQFKRYLASVSEGHWIQLERQTPLCHSVEGEKVDVLLLLFLVSLLGGLYWRSLGHWLCLRRNHLWWLLLIYLHCHLLHWSWLGDRLLTLSCIVRLALHLDIAQVVLLELSRLCSAIS